MAFLLQIVLFLALFLDSRGDEGSLAEFEQRLLDLLFCVHHEWTIPRNGLVQRLSGNQQKANRMRASDHLHVITVTQYDEPWRRNLCPVHPIVTCKLRLALEHIGERRVS